MGCKQQYHEDEPDSTKELTNRAVTILDAKYEKADLPEIVETQCRHLDAHQRKELLDLLLVQHRGQRRGCIVEMKSRIAVQMPIGIEETAVATKVNQM